MPAEIGCLTRLAWGCLGYPIFILVLCWKLGHTPLMKVRLSHLSSYMIIRHGSLANEIGLQFTPFARHGSEA